METKICNVCSEEKILDEFNKAPGQKDGLKKRCKRCDSIKQKEYRIKYPERIKEKSKRDHQKRYWGSEERRFKEIEKSKEYSKKNPDWKKIKRKEYHERKKNNINYKINLSIGSGLRKHIKNKKNNRHWEDLVGYNIEDLINHLESLFREGMTWDNYGTYWHIDHIRPKSWFLFESVEDQAFKDCWALSNLQPLEASINCSKCNRYEG